MGKKKKPLFTVRPIEKELLDLLKKNGGEMKLDDIKLIKPHEKPIVDMGDRGFMDIDEYNRYFILNFIEWFSEIFSYDEKTDTVRLLKRDKK
ncbi:MAG TPA: hypothetical protein P5056_02350 [Candidatus Paceibacterota bacterium]|nr:hypothetical protein [Candidatus Paceibacterota bacterium]